MVPAPHPSPATPDAADSRARLDEAPTQVEPPALQAERDAVLALWQAVFGAGH